MIICLFILVSFSTKQINGFNFWVDTNSYWVELAMAEEKNEAEKRQDIRYEKQKEQRKRFFAQKKLFVHQKLDEWRAQEKIEREKAASLRDERYHFALLYFEQSLKNGGILIPELEQFAQENKSAAAAVHILIESGLFDGKKIPKIVLEALKN